MRKLEGSRSRAPVTAATAHVDGGELWWEAFGRPGASNVLLHPGRGDTADVFPPSFCERLTTAVDCVVRFDPRDTGRSLRTRESESYDLTTLADDLWAVADAAGVRQTTLIGYSLGAVVVQQAALRHRERVTAMVLLATVARPPETETSPEALEQIAAASAADLDASFEPTALQLHGGGDSDLAELHQRYSGGRGPTSRSIQKHGQAAWSGPIPTDRELGSVEVPVLVLHSTDDRVVPHRQAEAIARPYPNATVARFGGIGHVPFERQWLQIADDIISGLWPEAVTSGQSARAGSPARRLS